jgi:hypothetical protein
MQKAFSLQPNETRTLELLQSQMQRALAQVGEATLILEESKAALKTAQETQRSLLGMVILRHGVTQFQNARFENNNLVCEVPDEPVAEPSKPLVNGSPKGVIDGVALSK